MQKFPYEFCMRPILSENLSKYEINENAVELSEAFRTKLICLRIVRGTAQKSGETLLRISCRDTGLLGNLQM